MTRPPRAWANRILDHNLVDNRNRRLTAKARIRGLETQDQVDTWISVETNIDRGPRDRVIDWLDTRNEYLSVAGDQPDDLSTLPRADRDVPDRDVILIRDGEAIPLEEARSNSATQKLKQKGGPD